MRWLALLAFVATPAHAQLVSPPGVTIGQVQALMDQSIAPVLAKADSAMTKADAAIADGLTSANRQQALRIQVTPDANGRAVFTYPMPYVAGTKPAVTTTAETPNGATYRNDASVEENSATNTQVVILVQRVPKTIVVSLLGAVTNIIAPVTTPVWINVLVRAPV
ncbi:hypothetical protein [Sphingomonas sp. R86520]|uniref:hypothetical protein n=1 Tax=Sphingomonas sp. R86520 TaxID=3093859 RepID=UPI0036D3624B